MGRSSFWRFDPGPCPICGAAHTACRGSVGPILVPQLPARDAATDGELQGPAPIADLEPPPLVAEQVQQGLPEGEFTSGTYRGDKKKRR